MTEKTRRIHDGIVGALLVLGVVLGFKINPIWFYGPGLVGTLMLVSAFTGFCPVYFTLDKCGLK